MIIIIRAKRPTQLFAILAAFLLAACTVRAQDAPPAGTLPEPATSRLHAQIPRRPGALRLRVRCAGYMRVVMRAQMLFNKHYGHYATSLTQLVHTGTFTQRMVNPERGDYTVGFKGKKDGFFLTMTPKNLDAQHRSFYAEEDGKIHADESKAADSNSQVVETHRWQ